MNFALTPELVPWILSGGIALIVLVVSFAFSGGGRVEHRPD
jgi:hypothetical protein